MHQLPNRESLSDLSSFGIQTLSDKDVESDFKLLMKEQNLDIDGIDDDIDDDELASTLRELGIKNEKSIFKCSYSSTKIEITDNEESNIQVTDTDLMDSNLTMELAAEFGWVEESQGNEAKSLISEELNKQIMSCKKLALELKRKGDIPEALKVMKRIKELEKQLQDYNLTKETVEIKNIESHHVNIKQKEISNTLLKPERMDISESSKRDVNLSSNKEVLEKKDEFDEDRDDISVTEEDMDDPSFNAELAAFMKDEKQEITNNKLYKTPYEVQDFEDDLEDEFEDQNEIISEQEEEKTEKIRQEKSEQKVKSRLQKDEHEEIISKKFNEQKEEIVKQQDEETEKIRQQKFLNLEKLLVHYGNQALAEAKKVSNLDRAKAAALLRKRKYYCEELEKLRKLRDMIQSPPDYFIEKTIERIEIVNEEIPEDQICIHILSLESCSDLYGQELYIKFDMGIPTVQGITSTFTCRMESCKIDFKRCFPLQKAKSIELAFQVRKASFELWKAGGFLKKEKLIGKAIIELKQFLSISKVNVLSPLLNSNRRKIGGSIHLEILLRTPIKEKDIRTTEVEELIIKEYSMEVKE